MNYKCYFDFTDISHTTMKIKNKVRIKRVIGLLKICFSVVGVFITMMSVLTSILTWTNKTESEFYKDCINFFNAIVDKPDLYIKYVVLCVLLLFVLIIIWIFVFTDRRIKVKLKNGRMIEIKRCDLFKQNGFLVIHCHDTFVMDNNNPVIKDDSVLGEFTRINEAHLDEIKKQIEKRFLVMEIGETCLIESSNIGKYILFAFSHQDSDNVKLSDKEYMEVIKNLWNALGTKYNNSINKDSWVNVVVMGDKRNTLSLDSVQMILYMVQTFISSNAKNNLRICLKKGQYKNVDLNGLKYIIEHMK